jgi:hypothetical protein
MVLHLLVWGWIGRPRKTQEDLRELGEICSSAHRSTLIRSTLQRSMVWARSGPTLTMVMGRSRAFSK